MAEEENEDPSWRRVLYFQARIWLWVPPTQDATKWGYEEFIVGQSLVKTKIFSEEILDR